LEHGQIRPSLIDDIPLARRQINSLKKLGIDLDAVTGQLMKDGVQAFVQSFDQMLASLQTRMQKS
jgi:transaldolase